MHTPGLSHRTQRLILVLTFLVGISAFFFLTNLTSDSSDHAWADSEECGSCHDGIRTFSLRENAPLEIPTNTTFSYEVTIINHAGNDGNAHHLKDNEFTLEIVGDVVRPAAGETYTKSCPDILTSKNGGPEEKTVNWTLETTGEGKAAIKVYVNSTAHYDHKSDSDPDDYRYFKESENRTITVKPLPIVLSDYAFSVQKEKTETFVLVVDVRENISDFVVEMPSNLRNPIEFNSSHPDWIGNGFDELSKDDIVLFEITVTGERSKEETVLLRWKDSSNNTQSLELRFTVYSKGKGGGGEGKFYKDVSKFLGYFSLGLLVLLSVVGSRAKPVKVLMKKLSISSSEKITLHCWLSFVLLITSILHGVIHMVRKSTLFLDRGDVLLGDVSAVFMAILAVNGLVQRELIRSYGYKNWWFIHVGASVGAIVADVVHVLYAEEIL